MNVRSWAILGGISLQMLAIAESEVTSVATLAMPREHVSVFRLLEYSGNYILR